MSMLTVLIWVKYDKTINIIYKVFIPRVRFSKIFVIVFYKKRNWHGLYSIATNYQQYIPTGKNMFFVLVLDILTGVTNRGRLGGRLGGRLNFWGIYPKFRLPDAKNER